jgi:hypothetical protein
MCQRCGQGRSAGSWSLFRSRRTLRGAPAGPLTGAGAPILLVHSSLELESTPFSVSSPQLASGQNFLARRAILAPVDVETTSDDLLLNSLCQFDLWWCVIADLNSEGEKSGFEFYPNFAVFHGYRTEPAVDIIATDSEVRSVAFPGSSEEAVASALAKVLAIAGRESRNQGFHTEVKLSTDAHKFIDRGQT